ncbi:LprO protein, partial [Staphylococcus sp. KY49P]|nr:LprO protein [Staphylococcus sp. KY49P]
GPTHGTHNEPNQFFAGPNYFINNNNEQIALDALFWVLDQTSRIDIYYSKKVSDPAIELYANELSLSGYHFIAISGSGLPVRGLTPLPTPDSGDSETTRLAMGADD